MLLTVSITHIQLHIHGFSWPVSLYGSSQSAETYLRGEELWFESHITMVRQNRSNLHIRKLKLHGYVNKYVFISVLHLSTLSGRFRVGFGVRQKFLFETVVKCAVRYLKRVSLKSAQRYEFV